MFLLKNGRFTLNLENLDFEGETLLLIGDDDPTVIVPLRPKSITDYGLLCLTSSVHYDTHIAS